MHRSEASLGGEITRTTTTSLVGLSMDVLQLLEDIDDIDFRDLDDDEDEITRQNTAKNAGSGVTSPHSSNGSKGSKFSSRKNSEKYKRKYSESVNKVKQIDNPNMKKLAFLHELEHSSSLDEEEKHNLLFGGTANDSVNSDINETDDTGANSKHFTQSAPNLQNPLTPPLSPQNGMVSTTDNDDACSLNGDDNDNDNQADTEDAFDAPWVSRTRSKAKTEEHIEYLPESYTMDKSAQRYNNYTMSTTKPSNVNNPRQSAKVTYNNRFMSPSPNGAVPISSPMSMNGMPMSYSPQFAGLDDNGYAQSLPVHVMMAYQQQQYDANYPDGYPPHIAQSQPDQEVVDYEHMAHIMQAQSRSMQIIPRGQHNMNGNHMQRPQQQQQYSMPMMMKIQSRSAQMLSGFNKHGQPEDDDDEKEAEDVELDYKSFNRATMLNTVLQSQSLQILPFAKQRKSKQPADVRPQRASQQVPKTDTSLRREPSDLFVQRPIREVARILYDLVEPIKLDRKYKMHTYTNCFIGRDVITLMERNNLCLHRKHAVQLCREMEEMGIIHHVLYEKGKAFADNKDSVYQFTIDDDGIAQKKNQGDLDVAFGLVKQVETADLFDFAKNGHQHTFQEQIEPIIQQQSSHKNKLEEKMNEDDDESAMPQYTKLPSQLLSTLNLKDFKRRHSTLSEFKTTQDHVVELPELSGWMFKQSATGFRSWQKRWIIVRRTHILWSKRMIDTKNPLDPNERRKFNNSMTLLAIRNVRPVSSKRKRKFDIITPTKTYHFKCTTAQQRDLWLKGLQLHLRALSESMKFLRSSFIFKEN